ncbi:MAG: 50S ribosomal protein L31 [Candidatus Omnitrophica bacterium]|nr:50S ribosomal protein L31 [Candidatus Omnitrophota bacterium]MBU4488345.1 50S ribosomal protein L31 [Candidatus Omnitrophota bacterium]
MKKKIHPDYKESTINCACGEVMHTRSTRPNIRVDICSKCHPFFTGKQKLVDSAGMVDKFKKRYEKTEAKKRVTKPAAARADQQAEETGEKESE